MTVQVECVYSDKTQPYERHFHNAYELLYIVGGEAEMRIGKKVYPLLPHTLVFVSKLEEHSVRVTGEDYRRYCLLIPTDELPRLIPEARLRGAFINRPADYSHVFPIEHYRALDALWPMLTQEVAGQEVYSELAVASLLAQILITCYREHTDRFADVYQPINPAIYEIRAYLEQHYNEPVSMAQLAQRFFLNPCYVSHSFAQAVGCSPKRYVMLNRIAKAKEFLLHSDLSIQEISIRCGFNDSNNFIRVFKKETGLPPRQYRAGAEARNMV